MTGVNPLTAMAQGVRFYSRLRVPRLPWEADPFAAPDGAMMARTLPFSALVIVAPAAGVLWLGVASGLPSMLSATLAIIALTLTTGAFHEDGLADTADGFGGGATRERRLDIMKDSRVGTFGASALALGFILRIGALAHLLDVHGLRMTLTVLSVAAVLSRVVGLVPLGLLPSARSEGAGFAVGRPTLATIFIALMMSAALAAALSHIGGMPLLWAPAMIGACIGIALAMTWLSARMIAGQTGDVAGATQQIAEACCYVLPLISLLRG